MIKKLLFFLALLPMFIFGLPKNGCPKKENPLFQFINAKPVKTSADITTQYNDFNHVVTGNYIGSYDGSENGYIRMQNNTFEVAIDILWDFGVYYNTGDYIDLNCYPALPDMQLGQIYGQNGIETGFFAKIENNRFIIYSTDPYNYSYFTQFSLFFEVDMNCVSYWYKDMDGDGFGNPNSIPVTNCYQPDYNYVDNNLDCDDQHQNITTGQNWYYDSDNDGFGDSTDYNPIISCTKPYGNYVSNNLDTCPTSSSTTGNGCPAAAALVNENYIYTILPTEPTTNISSLNNNEKIETIAYFDGLGRPMQNIGIRAGEVKDPVTGNLIFKDIITPIEYDAFGRQVRDYLPYAATSNGGLYRGSALTDIISYYSNDSKYEYTTNPYSEKQFEASPLNRVLKQAAPGNDWKLNNDHEIKFAYQTNSANEVKNFEVVFAPDIYNPTLTLSSVNGGYYNANELYKTITYDENTTANPTDETLGSTIEFKNKQGQVVLKRTYGTVGTGSTNEKHDTYYVYDDYGNLSYVLPPKMEGTTAAISTINSQLGDLGYQYIYDNRNRLVEKKLPGKQWEYIVYDKLDRVVLTQDPNLKSQNKWLFTKYDAFSRPVYTGVISSSKSRTDLQDDLNLETIHFESRGTTPPLDGISTYYTNNSFPRTDIIELHTINYYDDYDFDKDGGVSEPVGTNPQVIPSTATKSLATGSKIRVLGSPNWITNVIYYDAKGRPIYNYSKNDFLSTIQKVKTELDFVGKPTKTTTTHQRNNVMTTVVDNFTYDHQGRLLTQIQKINNQGEELLVSNEYDELGQLFKKGVGGKAATSNRLQTVDYTYNIRGWLKGINDGDSNNADITMGTGDLFGFQINYNDGPTDPLKKLYNGNISQTFWKTTNPIDTNLRSYNYSYDALNRLTEAQYSLSTPNRFNENLTYDKNGNIMSLVRNGYTDSGATQLGTMDNLAYTYDVGNKLFKVKDNSGSNEGFKDGADSTQEYTYDDNGNMKTDDNKGITAITYNHLNLPTSVTMTGGIINYTYDATGVKQRKVAAGTTTEYSGGFQYKDAVLQFFPISEGYAEYNNGNGIFSYIYQYKDHLGNVRLSYKDVGTTTPNLQIVEESNYYPFGMKQKVAGEVINNSSYKYKYNGKELQDELGLNMYDYAARNYDPALGRWMNIDPAAEYFPDITPYAYVVNDPMGFVDNDGEMPGPVGAIVGVFSDYIMQVGVNYFIDREDFRTSLTDISPWSLTVSGASGFVSGGISALTNMATSKIGSQALAKTIDFGVDVLVTTVESTVTQQLETGEFDIWKSFTGGLLEAGIGKFIPLKYVDKLEKKLFKKMNVSAEKMARYKNRMRNDSNRNARTRARNNRKYAENAKQHKSYTEAFAGVKTVNDAYKAGGAEALQDIALYKKTTEENKKSKVIVEKLDEGTIIKE